MSYKEINHKFNENKTKSVLHSKTKIEGTVNQQIIDKNISLVKIDLELKDDTSMDSNFSVDGIMFSFNLQGHSEHSSQISDFKLKNNTNDTNIILTKNEISKTTIQKGKIDMIGLVLKKDFIKKNLPESNGKDKLLNSLENNICHELLSSKKTSFHTQLLLNDIFSSSFVNNLNDMYVHSKILELLFLEFKNLYPKINSSLNISNLKLDEYDINAIKKAKEILMQNIQNPPSIVELAKLVRINDFKLKSGFKKIFNITPYNLLIEHRLDLAKKLLIDSDMSIGEIANKVGYKYNANFTVAFTKKFKILPKDIMKNRKYYY
ncbi:AraC family transcriptional regulator [Sulfurimonas sp.]|uniref:helix-turn-helix transcriptional regulator n=1 Tax=Sulfurimonas sp. TaxID=2022749 RepID=UPI002B46E821|nr:AraC family transcriptional regulator [Sulfurimonas sp.]